MCKSICFPFVGVCETILLKLVILLEDKQKDVACSLLQRCYTSAWHENFSGVKSDSQISGLNNTSSGCFHGVQGMPEKQTGAQVSAPCCNGYRFQFLSA